MICRLNLGHPVYRPCHGAADGRHAGGQVILRPPQILSDCETYEYEFRRVWDPSAPLALWIMLNPSMIHPFPGDLPTSPDGKTVAQCASFSRQWGCGGLVTGNVFAYRATDPKQLKVCADPVGPDNDATLRRLLDEATVVIAAWGASFPSRYAGRVGDVRDLLRAKGAECLGKTVQDQPRHPSRLSLNTQRVPL